MSRVIYGARVSVVVAFVPTAVSLVIGLLVGLLAGYMGGWVDNLLMRLTDIIYAFPDLLTFHDAATPIEQRLFVMHLEHRMRAFQGTFHANPDHALWYGWSEMQRDLTEIRAMAKEIRAAHGK